ncbi:GAF domain-containing protein [Haloarchaeobius sp. TZWWS8]|uniref:GAF domain-containing protein n=1 Tax=Haloarchaeobius sp. TZWWS8 TaxID=3446121 RepID=UPI003EB872DB
MSDSECGPTRVRTVCGSRTSGEELKTLLEREGATVDVCSGTDAGVDEVGAGVDCLVYSDDGDLDCLKRLRVVRETNPDLPVVILARDGDETFASEAVRAGVTDYVPVDGPLSERAADRVLEASATARGRTADDDTEAELSVRERALRDAYEITANVDRSFEERIEELLHVVRKAVGTDYATLSRVQGDEYIFEAIDAPADAGIGRGDVVPLEATNCERVVETERTLVLRDVAEDAPDLAGRAGNKDWGISCYLGAPVTVDGSPYGTFCFYDTEARAEEFSDWQVTFVEIFSNWVSYELERQQYIDQLTALDELNGVVRQVTDAVMGQSTRETIEASACQCLAEASTYEFAWVGAADLEVEAVEYRAEAGSDGYLDDITISTAPADETANGSTGRAVRTGTVQVVQSVHDDDYEPWREAADEHGIEASAAVPITHDDHVYGVLNVCTSRTNPFDDQEKKVLKQLGEIIGLAIAAIEREAELRENERRYRTLTENIPDASVTLFDTDLRYLTIAGALYDEYEFEPSSVRGKRMTDVDVELPVHGDEYLAACQSALDGDTQDVQLLAENRAFRVMALPLRGEHGEVTGGMTFTQDVTERHLHERQIEHERERLEFMNRIIRHNLLNGMNVVRARADLLDGHVDEAMVTHLSTVQHRIEDMIDLIETMRSFMKAIVEGEEHEPEPTDLAAVVEGEVEQARDAYDDAVFECDELPRVEVMADDLLPEVFENLLTNAVQHNDKPTTMVEVWTDVGDDEVVVHVSDNGPGIDETLRDAVFEKGRKGFASPGTGFGLYLVREIIDSCGGSVSVHDNDDEGVTFDIALARV